MQSATIKKIFKSARRAFANMRSGEDVHPFYASFKINDRCGKKCSFCNVWKRPPRPQLPTSDVLRVLDNLAESSILVVSFEGGEPFLREDLPEILAYARHKGFITETTTSGNHADDAYVRACCESLNYLHISIDEGHDNLELLTDLTRFRKGRAQPVVQIVVTKDTLHALEDKIAVLHRAGVGAIVMPATHVEHTKDFYPNPGEFRRTLLRLKRRYPGIIMTPGRYLDSINGAERCTASSIIIDCDGGLYYPCSVLGDKPVSLVDNSLTDFVKSPLGYEKRRISEQCRKNCGWYQYFATPTCTNPASIAKFLAIYSRSGLRHKLTARRRNGHKSTVQGVELGARSCDPEPAPDQTADRRAV